jgi:hypothetical protein
MLIKRTFMQIGTFCAPTGRHHRPVHRFGLDDIAAAHEAVERGITGKVLVTLAAEDGA